MLVVLLTGLAEPVGPYPERHLRVALVEGIGVNRIYR